LEKYSIFATRCRFVEKIFRKLSVLEDIILQKASFHMARFPICGIMLRPKYFK